METVVCPHCNSILVSALLAHHVLASGLGVFILILGLGIWSSVRAQNKADQERTDYREAVRRVEAGRKLNEDSHGDEFNKL